MRRGIARPAARLAARSVRVASRFTSRPLRVALARRVADDGREVDDRVDLFQHGRANAGITDIATNELETGIRPELEQRTAVSTAMESSTYRASREQVSDRVDPT